MVTILQVVPSFETRVLGIVNRRGPSTLIDRQDITELDPAENHEVSY